MAAFVKLKYNLQPEAFRPIQYPAINSLILNRIMLCEKDCRRTLRIQSIR
jgi:hypothetical protein